jgi:hypothetical protein
MRAITFKPDQTLVNQTLVIIIIIAVIIAIITAVIIAITTIRIQHVISIAVIVGVVTAISVGPSYINGGSNWQH